MSTTTLDPETEIKPKPKKREKTEFKLLPPFNVILINDDDHSVDYVVDLCKKIFGHPTEKGLNIAKEVHFSGRSILWTGAKEVAELKQEQVHAFGPDKRIPACKGSMTAILEPAA